jgi:hypothetical protein
LLGWPCLAEIRRCASFVAADAPNELWILRSNSQQWPYPPEINAKVQDRMDERMGNLSLNKDLDVIQKVNDWNTRYKDFAADQKHVTVPQDEGTYRRRTAIFLKLRPRSQLHGQAAA